MSAGAFLVTKYQATYAAANIHPIKVQPETVAATIGGTPNAAPTGAVTNPISARVSGGKRTRGLVPRVVVLRAPAANPPAGYLANGITRIPALTPAFSAVAIAGAACTYLGVAFTVISSLPEVAR